MTANPTGSTANDPETINCIELHDRADDDTVTAEVTCDNDTQTCTLATQPVTLALAKRGDC